MSEFSLFRRSSSAIYGACLLAVLSCSSLLQGCATRERVVVQAQVGSPVRYMPAPIHEDRGYAPAPGWAWVPGHWKWEGRDWVWAHGHWVQQQVVQPMPPVIVEQVTVAPSPHHYWVPGHWVWRLDGNGSWFWVGGRWHS